MPVNLFFQNYLFTLWSVWIKVTTLQRASLVIDETPLSWSIRVMFPRALTFLPIPKRTDSFSDWHSVVRRWHTNSQIMSNHRLFSDIQLDSSRCADLSDIVGKVISSNDHRLNQWTEIFFVFQKSQRQSNGSLQQYSNWSANRGVSFDWAIQSRC